MKVLNQNVDKTKRKRFATFAVSIVVKLMLTAAMKWNTIKYDIRDKNSYRNLVF